jgi:hypothetical protein
MLPNRSNDRPTTSPEVRRQPASAAPAQSPTFEDLLQEAIDASNHFRTTVDRLPGRLSNRRSD